MSGEADCYDCAVEEDRKRGDGMWLRSISVMFVCPECGNKRCPKATNHRHACTGSNEDGQPGSRYSVPIGEAGAQRLTD